MRGHGLRIIAGRFRGRRIAVPPAAAVRPTPERVREALFSILGARLAGAAVLDAFAGSGAMGFEAASRGAAVVVFAESNPNVAAGLRANATRLGLADACRIVEGDLPGVIVRADLAGPFDVVLADPPHALAEGDCDRALEALAGILGARGRLAWERASRSRPPQASGLELLESRRYGNTTVDLYRRGPADGPAGGS